MDTLSVLDAPTSAPCPAAWLPAVPDRAGFRCWLRATFGETDADDPAGAALEVCDGDTVAAGRLLAEWRQPVPSRPF